MKRSTESVLRFHFVQVRYGPGILFDRCRGFTSSSTVRVKLDMNFWQQSGCPLYFRVNISNRRKCKKERPEGRILQGITGIPTYSHGYVQEGTEWPTVRRVIFNKERRRWWPYDKSGPDGWQILSFLKRSTTQGHGTQEGTVVVEFDESLTTMKEKRMEYWDKDVAKGRVASEHQTRCVCQVLKKS